jgi:hypothetical protein
MRRSLTPELIEGFFEALDTPVALSCYMLFREGEHEQLARKTLDPRSYADSEAFYLDYLAVRFLVKYTGLRTGIDTRRVAIDEFHRCEHKCSVVNSQLMDMFEDDPVIALNSTNDWRFSRIITWLSVKISSVIGPLDWDEVADACRFGPGSTTRVGGTKTSTYEKFRGNPHSTRGALPYALALSEAWESFPHRIEQVAGNTVTFVPKNAKTDRVIAIEPCMNQFMQLGAGIVLRDRLKRFGVDIRDQTRNQQLAYQGSLHGTHCTVDMKSASDLISRMAVALLLPDDWYGILNALRSKQYTLDGRSGTYEKFSSMGNGFTFPLQTLLFWALACLSCKLSNVGSSAIGVYGDDVVVPPEAYAVFLRLLNLFGFEPNSEKSYGEGPFRESCGKDYFDGWDCQPLYLKEPILEGMELVKFANRVRRLSIRSRNGFGCDSRFHTLWQCAVKHLPAGLRRTRIPEGYGDGGLVVSFEEACPQRAPRQSEVWETGFLRPGETLAARAARVIPLGCEGFTYTRWVFVPEKYEMVDEMGTLRYALFAAQGIKSPPRGWMVNGRTPDDYHLEIRDRPFDAYRDFERTSGDPTGHPMATHRKKGKYVRRRGVARNWPSLGGWI